MVDYVISGRFGQRLVEADARRRIELGEGGGDVPRPTEPRYIAIDDDPDFRSHTRVEPLLEPVQLTPGETLHGITRERIRLPGDICGTLEGRSRFARLGLMIHVTSAFVQPGVDNRQVLEMSNVSSRPLLIHAGTRICQIVLMRTEGEAFHDGRFARQTEI